MSFTFDTPAVDEFEETLSFRKDTTGVDNTIFISAHAGNAAHGPRVARRRQDHPARSVTARVSRHGQNF